MCERLVSTIYSHFLWHLCSYFQHYDHVSLSEHQPTSNWTDDGKYFLKRKGCQSLLVQEGFSPVNHFLLSLC